MVGRQVGVTIFEKDVALGVSGVSICVAGNVRAGVKRGASVGITIEGSGVVIACIVCNRSLFVSGGLTVGIVERQANIAKNATKMTPTQSRMYLLIRSLPQ